MTHITDTLKAFHSGDPKLKARASLHYGIGYLEEALRELNGLEELLSDGYTVEDLDALLARKRADDSLSSALRFLEMFKKGGTA